MPGSEIPDSSSFHSNESNESRNLHLNHHHVPSRRGVETLEEDVESCNGDEDSLNPLDSGGEEYRFTTGRLDACFA